MKRIDRPVSLSPGPSCNGPGAQFGSEGVFFLLLLRQLLPPPEPAKRATDKPKMKFLILLFLQSGLKQYVKSHISHPCSVRLKRLFGGVTFTYTKISHSSQGYNQGLEKLHFSIN